MRAVREALAAFRRAPLLGGLSVVAIGFSLLIVGLFGLTTHNIDEALSDVEERVEVVGYLTEDASEEQVTVAREEIGNYPEISRVRYVSKTEALLNASRELPEFSDVFSDLEVNPLPASLELSLKPGFRDPRHVGAIVDRLRTYAFIEDVRFGQGWVERVHALRRVAGAAAALLGGAFAAVAIMLIGTAVRMAILARSEEITIMELVGATPGYIQRPFLIEGLITGTLGGLVALILTRLVYQLVNASFFRMEWLPDLWMILGVGGAALLGMLAAGQAVRRELRRNLAG
ncbi:MAG: cell division protein FtsX [Gemmatimonadota bacterium]